MKSSKPQKLYATINRATGLFFINVINHDRVIKSKSFIKSRYNQAVKRNNEIGKATSSAGLEIALLETDGEGWEALDLGGEYKTEDVNQAITNIVNAWSSDPNLVYIGSNFKKGVYGSSELEHGFNKRYPANVNIKKFYGYFDIIETVMKIEIPNYIKTAAFIAYNTTEEIIDNLSLYRFVKRRINT